MIDELPLSDFPRAFSGIIPLELHKLSTYLDQSCPCEPMQNSQKAKCGAIVTGESNSVGSKPGFEPGVTPRLFKALREYVATTPYGQFAIDFAKANMNHVKT